MSAKTIGKLTEHERDTKSVIAQGKLWGIKILFYKGCTFVPLTKKGNRMMQLFHFFIRRTEFVVRFFEMIFTRKASFYIGYQFTDMQFVDRDTWLKEWVE